MFKSLFKFKKAASLRDGMLKYVIRILQEKKHKDIRAIAPDFTMPKRVVRESSGEGYIPEVTAVKNGQFRLFALETKETLELNETEKRWELFSSYAKQDHALFYVVFPAGMEAKVKAKLKDLNIEARLWQASSG